MERRLSAKQLMAKAVRRFDSVTPLQFMNAEDTIIEGFLSRNPQYKKIEWCAQCDDLTAYFQDSPEPFSRLEFMRGSPTRTLLDKLYCDLTTNKAAKSTNMCGKQGLI